MRRRVLTILTVVHRFRFYVYRRQKVLKLFAKDSSEIQRRGWLPSLKTTPLSLFVSILTSLCFPQHPTFIPWTFSNAFGPWTGLRDWASLATSAMRSATVWSTSTGAVLSFIFVHSPLLSIDVFFFPIVIGRETAFHGLGIPTSKTWTTPPWGSAFSVFTDMTWRLVI